MYNKIQYNEENDTIEFSGHITSYMFYNELLSELVKRKKIDKERGNSN
jgi:hypothetical protein